MESALQKRITISPTPIQANLEVGNRVIKISGSSLSPIEVKNVQSSTAAFLTKVVIISENGQFVISSGENNEPAEGQ